MRGWSKSTCSAIVRSPSFVMPWPRSTATPAALIDYAAWDPISDPDTQELIRRGDTMGCFYVESPATRLLLKKLWTTMPPAQRARRMSLSISWPSPPSSVPRPMCLPMTSSGARTDSRIAPCTRCSMTVLAETHGIMVYQEDVMKVAVALGGFSVHDGDQLRKILSKKHKERQLRDYQRQFYAGAAARQIPARWSIRSGP
jgi:DNA polymerase III alpha subunit